MKCIFFAVLMSCVCASPAFAQVDERVMYAGVVDDQGAPVSGLRVEDFIVREDGMAREVLSVEKDEDPLQIALLVDNSVVMRDKVMDLRRAVGAFVDSLRPGIQVSLITLAERPTIVVSYTADHVLLRRGIERILSYQAASTLLDAIVEASQGLSKRKEARSAIAVVTARGPELSYRDYNDVIRVVGQAEGTAVHAMVLSGSEFNDDRFNVQPLFSGDSPERVAGVGREMALGLLTRDTGGRYEEVLSMSGLDMKLQQMAGELSSQYRVVFASPQRLIPAKTTEISARDPKLKARGTVVSQKN